MMMIPVTIITVVRLWCTLKKLKKTLLHSIHVGYLRVCRVATVGWGGGGGGGKGEGGRKVGGGGRKGSEGILPETQTSLGTLPQLAIISSVSDNPFAPPKQRTAADNGDGENAIKPRRRHAMQICPNRRKTTTV